MLNIIMQLFITSLLANTEILESMKRDLTIKEIINSNSLCNEYNQLIEENKTKDDKLRCNNEGTPDIQLNSNINILEKQIVESINYVDKHQDNIDQYQIKIMFGGK